MSETENSNIEQNQELEQKPESAEQTQPNQSGAPVFHLDGILGKRLIASFIDAVLIGVVSTILALVGHLLPKIAFINLSSAWSAIVFGAAAAVFMAKDGPIVFAGLEGQTPGKKVMGIRVTDLKQKPISFEVSVKRNFILGIPYIFSAIMSLIGIIHIPFISGLIIGLLSLVCGLISMLIFLFEVYKIYSGERNRRWGDTYAGTIVAWE